jgi:two-component system invasion response regulator UvrY
VTDVSPVAVLVVDDQAPFRSAARAVIGMAKGFDLIGEAESGEQAVQLVEELTPGLVLMDINMGAMNGIEAARRITAAHPGVMVLLLSTYSVDDLPPDARTSGAAAYVHKEELTPRILRRMWDEGGDEDWRSGARNGAGHPGAASPF